MKRELLLEILPYKRNVQLPGTIVREFTIYRKFDKNKRHCICKDYDCVVKNKYYHGNLTSEERIKYNQNKNNIDNSVDDSIMAMGFKWMHDFFIISHGGGTSLYIRLTFKKLSIIKKTDNLNFHQYMFSLLKLLGIEIYKICETNSTIKNKNTEIKKLLVKSRRILNEKIKTL